MKLYLLLVLLLINLVSLCQVKVRGYYRSNGTYVQPHYRSSPDGNPYNNYSYPGNTNPYTGKVSSGNPDTYLERYYNRQGKTRRSSNKHLAPANRSSEFYNIGNRRYTSKSYALLTTDYQVMIRGRRKGQYFEIIDDKGVKLGHASQKGSRQYRIYDDSEQRIGYVKVFRHRYYAVYDKTGHRIFNNRPRTRFLPKILPALLTAAGCVLLYSQL